jgi:hypothetical protein
MVFAHVRYFKRDVSQFEKLSLFVSFLLRFCGIHPKIRKFLLDDSARLNRSQVALTSTNSVK